MKSYILYSYNELKNSGHLQDGLFCGFYNKENAVIQIKDGLPVQVQFANNSRIFDHKGVTLSSLELLISLT